ncbi:MAG TPA: M56 family metallopeptidase, partial [Gammaproteobacteria bacterium]
MIAEAILAALVRLNVVASVAILVVLALRPIVLRRLGANVAYWLWSIVPIVAIASFVPAREQVVVVPPYASTAITEDSILAVDASTQPVGASIPVPAKAGAAPTLADVAMVLWLLGAIALLARSIVATRRLARDPSVGPALVGVLRPRLVLPADFEARFNAHERALILAHEGMHRVSGHTVVNALVEVARCLSWFNPLAHFAASRLRMDQELACDAAVIAARPHERRAYAQALLRTQLGTAFLPLGCTWTSRSAKRIAERIEMVGRASSSRRAKLAGAAGVLIVGTALGYTVWAQQPERVVTQVAVRPEAVWTPSVQAPPGTLAHALEGQRHDFFIELAQKGDIDLVFFGATTTEMWWWPDRGRPVWDRELGALKAANFGAQGTHPESLVWRMQNGELDGYRAKLVVLSDAHTPGEASPPDSRFKLPPNSRFSDWPSAYAAVIAEIRARQPQAKVLILAAFPRGFRTLPEWREIAAAQAATFAGLVDDETVFYDDLSERFYGPDGSYNRDLWGIPGPAGVGAQVPLFEVWAEGLEP